MQTLGLVVPDCAHTADCRRPENKSQVIARIQFILPETPGQDEQDARDDIEIIGKVMENLREHYAGILTDAKTLLDAMATMSRVAAEFIAAT